MTTTTRELTQVELINKEINKELANQETSRALLATTFKGLQPQVMKQAIMEGMLRGFTFKDFLEKNVYAVPFAGGYSLITSIDYARKIAMKSGLVGKSEPIYEEDDEGNIISCTVTVKRQVNSYVGDYTAKVYFKEYSTGRNLWVTKPRTMIAKVAEMHALRSAFPEEMKQQYVEEEIQKETEVLLPEKKVDDYKAKLEATTSLDEIKKVWSSLPPQAKQELKNLKDELKKKYENA